MAPLDPWPSAEVSVCAHVPADPSLGAGMEHLLREDLLWDAHNTLLEFRSSQESFFLCVRVCVCMYLWKITKIVVFFVWIKSQVGLICLNDWQLWRFAAAT